MRDFFYFTFLAFAVVPIVLELYKLMNGSVYGQITAYIKDLTEKGKKLEELDVEDPKYSGALAEQLLGILVVLAVIGFNIAYLAWIIIGLMTQQWQYFLALFGLAMVNLVFSYALPVKDYPKFQNYFQRVDSALSILIIVLMLVTATKI